MASEPLDSVVDLAPPASEAVADAVVEREVMLLFDRLATPLLRYVASFGLSREECEDVTQDVFLALFRHLRLGRAQDNLRGWLFRVAHNLALRQRNKNRRVRPALQWDDPTLDVRADPSPTPETRYVQRERRRTLVAIVRALSERDRRCLFLRAEGLAYREIAATLGMSLGGVAKSLRRAFARLLRADQE
jgi:RNA polymerase sigma-70 factor (ECF subfamily)